MNSVGGERHGLLARRVGSIVLVAEAHVVVVDVEQPVIGDRDAMGVATDVVEHLLRPGERPLWRRRPTRSAAAGATCGQRRADPATPRASPKNRSWPASKAACSAVQEETTEEAREHAHRQEEAGPTRDPARAIGREAAARDDTMEMRMMHQGLSPRVQHGEEADLRAEMLRIGGDGAQGLGGRAKQDAVDHALCSGRRWPRSRPAR